jgi:hypothetical protein
VASWLFFLRLGGSLRIDSDMLIARALKNSQLTDGESHVIYGTGLQEPESRSQEGAGTDEPRMEGSQTSPSRLKLWEATSGRPLWTVFKRPGDFCLGVCMTAQCFKRAAPAKRPNA